jgi:hypothetical protein
MSAREDMPQVPDRRSFVQGCTKRALSRTKYKNHRLEPEIVNVILRKVVVSNKEWDRVFRDEPERVNEAEMSSTLEKCIKEVLRFFPLDNLEPADLATIAAAAMIKYAPKTNIWPCEPLVRKVRPDAPAAERQAAFEERSMVTANKGRVRVATGRKLERA